MAVTAFTRTNCPSGRAGVSTAWLIDEKDVVDLTFDADYQISAITLDTAKFYHKIEFDKDTAFFNQEKTQVGRYNKNVAQNFQFVEGIIVNESLKFLRGINACCGMHIIVKMNTGTLLYGGISYFEDTDTWQTESMITGDGSANTGANPTSDLNEIIENLVCNTNFYAPVLAIAESAIVVS